MKVLLKTQFSLNKSGRCDIDYHLPPEHLKAFPSENITRVDQVAEVLKEKRNPGEELEDVFLYVNISSVDVVIGRIRDEEELLGSEAPSRARKIIRKSDVIISTCRPTRGAIAIVPDRLDNQICSTAFSVIRADPSEIIPEYLHWALRLPSTLEQFRKWSTGSSYPAILDEDVMKTLIPVPNLQLQKQIVREITAALKKRDERVRRAENEWEEVQEAAKVRLISNGRESQG